MDGGDRWQRTTYRHHEYRARDLNGEQHPAYWSSECRCYTHCTRSIVHMASQDVILVNPVEESDLLHQMVRYDGGGMNEWSFSANRDATSQRKCESNSFREKGSSSKISICFSAKIA